MTKAEVLLPEPLSLTCRRCGRSGLPQPPPPLPVLLLISNRVTMTRAAGGRERGENLPSSTFLDFFFFLIIFFLYFRLFFSLRGGRDPPRPFSPRACAARSPRLAAPSGPHPARGPLPRAVHRAPPSGGERSSLIPAHQREAPGGPAGWGGGAARVTPASTGEPIRASPRRTQIAVGAGCAPARWKGCECGRCVRA